MTFWCHLHRQRGYVGIMMVIVVLTAISTAQHGYYHNGLYSRVIHGTPVYSSRLAPSTYHIITHGSVVTSHNPYPQGTFYQDYYDALKMGRYGSMVEHNDSSGAYVYHDPGYMAAHDLQNRMHEELGYSSNGIQNNNIGLSTLDPGLGGFSRP